MVVGGREFLDWLRAGSFSGGTLLRGVQLDGWMGR